MTDHEIDYDTLIALALGEPVAIEPERVRLHLETCASCQKTISLLAAARSTVELDASAAPSARALDRVRNLMQRAERAPHAGLFGVLERVVAALTFDGRQAYAAAGFRGTSGSYLL